MLTYTLDREAGPLYEALYRGIRGDILEGRLMPGEKLPSKRALADHLKISKVTVETAYAQLVAEGYIRSQEKVGYFVEAVEQGQAPAYRRALELPKACLGGGFYGQQPAGGGLSLFRLGQASAGGASGLRSGASGAGAAWRRLCAPPGHCGLSVWIPLHDRLSGSDSGGSGHGLSV